MDDLICTAQAAELLGYSRPYVAMLIGQKKLQGATVSAGGHRRLSRAEGQKIGAYKSTEADAVRRIKVLGTAM
jgi:excisionase family DNA binding protein